MFQFQAPYPSLQTTTVLPDPQFSDQQAITDTITTKRAMDGTRYVYVQRSSGTTQAEVDVPSDPQ